MSPVILWEKGHKRLAQYSLEDIREELLIYDSHTKQYVWMNTHKSLEPYVYQIAKELDTYRTAYENISAFQGRKL